MVPTRARASRSAARQACWAGLLGAALLASRGVAAGEPSEQVVVTPEFVNRLAEEMRTNSPALRAASARSDAARFNVEAVRTWEDPMVMIGGMGADTMMRANEGDLIYGVDQRLPLFGKPKLERQMARAELAVELAMADFEFQRMRSELAQGLFRVALAQRVEAILEQDLTWLDTMVAATERRYQVGDAMYAQTLRLKNERAVLTNEIVSQTQRVARELAGVNRLLKRDVWFRWPVLVLPPVAGPLSYSERLASFALTNEPRLKVLREQARQADAAVQVARRERWPDFSVGAEARNYTWSGEFRQGMLTVSMNIPWGNAKRYRSQVNREQAKSKAAELEAADYELSIRQDVHRLALAIDTMRREAILYRDEVIPRSERALVSAEAAWTAGQAPLYEVLESRRMLNESRIMCVRATAEQYVMLSELVLCCGLGDLEALRRIGIQTTESDEKPR